VPAPRPRPRSRSRLAALVAVPLLLPGCYANDGGNEKVPDEETGQSPGRGELNVTDPPAPPLVTPLPGQSAGSSVRPDATPGYDGSDRGNG
jgi:hypothetical protein